MSKKDLTFKKFRKKNLRRMDEVFEETIDWDEGRWALALAGEVGELCNLVKKVIRGDFKDRTDVLGAHAQIGKEIADVVTYCDLLASHLGFDLDEILIQKFNEVSERRGSNVKF